MRSASYLVQSLSKYKDELGMADQTEYPLDYVLNNLGLNNPDNLDGITTTLDIGCGPNANLVEKLRARGIDARGADYCFSDNISQSKPHLAKAYANNLPFSGDFFDLITFHFIQFFVYGEKEFLETIAKAIKKDLRAGGGDNKKNKKRRLNQELEEVYRQGRQEMIKAADEAVRILKPDGKIIIWPYPSIFVAKERGFYDNKGVYFDAEWFQFKRHGSDERQTDEQKKRLIMTK